MGILHSFSRWNENRYEQKVSDMQERGLCPECRGLGINTIGLNEYLNYAQYSCPGCDGTGQYSSWANQSNFSD